MIPPVFGGFRKALKDVEFGGYLIPKGWQVSIHAELTLRRKCKFYNFSTENYAKTICFWFRL